MSPGEYPGQSPENRKLLSKKRKNSLKTETMKRTKLFIIAALLGVFANLQAQNELDALRYSQRFYGSTARSLSMGGAFTALGGDFASLGLNPAGIAVYRAGEFTITPVFNFQQSEADYMGTFSDEFKYSMGIDNLGFIGVVKTGRESGLVSFNFGVGYNRQNNFNRNIIMKGFNSYTSMADYFLEYANGLYPENLDPYWERLAFDTYVIDTISFPNFYETVPLGTEHKQTRNYSGSLSEWSFSGGFNIDNKLFIGAGLGIVSVYYSDRYNHTEIDTEDLNDFRQFTYKRRIITNGTGLNFKIGAIFRPIELLRIGASLHFPTFYKMDDEENASMESWFDTGEYYSAVPTTSSGSKMGARLKEYAIHSPLRANLGAALIFGKAGLVTADYEYVDYTTMRLRETDGGYDFDYENELIRDAFRPVHNIRLGGEFKMNNLAFRGGYGLYLSPYEKGQMNENANYSVYSAGVGIREGSFFVDFAYALSTQKESEYLYYYGGMPFQSRPSDNIYSNSSFKLTLGFRF